MDVSWLYHDSPLSVDLTDLPSTTAWDPIIAAYQIPYATKSPTVHTIVQQPHSLLGSHKMSEQTQPVQDSDPAKQKSTATPKVPKVPSNSVEVVEKLKTPDLPSKIKTPGPIFADDSDDSIIYTGKPASKNGGATKSNGAVTENVPRATTAEEAILNKFMKTTASTKLPAKPKVTKDGSAKPATPRKRLPKASQEPSTPSKDSGSPEPASAKLEAKKKPGRKPAVKENGAISSLKRKADEMSTGDAAKTLFSDFNDDEDHEVEQRMKAAKERIMAAKSKKKEIRLAAVS